MSTGDREKLAAAALGVATLLAALAIWVVGSHFEARAFNNVTGKNVSTWDAMFIDLRVNEGPK